MQNPDTYSLNKCLVVETELMRCGVAFFLVIPLKPKSNKNTVKTLSHSGTAPKALGVKFHFPWTNTGRGSESQRRTEERW